MSELEDWKCPMCSSTLCYIDGDDVWCRRCYYLKHNGSDPYSGQWGYPSAFMTTCTECDGKGWFRDPTVADETSPYAYTKCDNCLCGSVVDEPFCIEHGFRDHESWNEAIARKKASRNKGE